LRLAHRFNGIPFLARLFFGQRIAAVMGLTWKAAFRFRLFLVVTVLLLGAVVVCPGWLHDPHFTAQEFTQVQLTYTLSAVTALLGLATLWLACGTLARDIEECQMQVVVTKPIARWQIWVGKWLGLLSLKRGIARDCRRLHLWTTDASGAQAQLPTAGSFAQRSPRRPRRSA